ncbi:hypothetical protein [Pedobacter frigidisoli]|uniref:hypothetical protein n=1 Tax=Pedobacter frigidisoli TaxID=2530455 RepID=UPI0029301279|nr:hypothetical protein [Pedobacter frigidisoli]
MDTKKLLADLIAEPGKVRKSHVPFLKEMVAEHPYAQPLHLLLARAEASYVPRAALYSQGNVLFHILNMVPLDEELTPVTTELADLPAEEELFIESVAAIDFFEFEKKIDTVAVEQVPKIETVIPDEPDFSRVSKYDDDELPYTFLWWLAKTRKEHEQVFQPYAHRKPVEVSNKQDKPDEKEFQQQYVEHIFHIQTPFEVADHLAEYPAEIKDTKGAQIIEKFLKEDPTIKPPKPEQIDNENKAKKSAEDHYDLVSETLAKIYIEQMLYHKAIDTYKKLSLKYPEKSGYFADLIQSIEKKF